MKREDPKVKKKNGERPSMKRGNSKWGGEMNTAGKLLMREKRNGEMETNQICNEYRPSIQWQQAKHLGRWSSTLVCCPECREPKTIRHFYGKHAFEKHNLDFVSNACFVSKKTMASWAKESSRKRKPCHGVLATFRRGCQGGK
ncbi:hypothetical protein TNCV_2136001 [Trichonephila clavipes]|nr:hypothetical protein TNCV_2136001 [Trichonephila clavipes]